MTAPMTAERREYIERLLCIRLLQYSGQEYETTHCYNGLRDEAAATIGELLAEIDRLTAERDAAVAALKAAWKTLCNISGDSELKDRLSTAIARAEGRTP